MTEGTFVYSVHNCLWAPPYGEIDNLRLSLAEYPLAYSILSSLLLSSAIISYLNLNYNVAYLLSADPRLVTDA